MIKFNFTPVSGALIITGQYLYGESKADFQLELVWDSDMLMGTRINRIIFIDDIPEDIAVAAVEEIKQEYNNLEKQPVILVKNKTNNY
jgi:hypothetical protein